MRRLTLIRHGLTEGNVRRWYYGALDLPLCEAGADALREAAAAGLYPPIGQAKILTSGLLRTEQTLRLLYGDVPHEVWPDLREISFGIFEGKSYDELNGRADYAAWLATGSATCRRAASPLRRRRRGSSRGWRGCRRRGRIFLPLCTAGRF